MTSTTNVDLNQKIRNVIPWIVSTYKSKPDQCREVMHCIIEQLEADRSKYAILKLYVNYYLCELIINYVDEDEIKNFFTIVFPTPLQSLSKSFLEQLLSLSICLNNKQILTALAFYIDNNEIEIKDCEIKSFPDDVSTNCPLFVAALINKGVFFDNHNRDLYTTGLLNTWLSGLNLNNKQLKFDGQKLVRFVLNNNADCSSLLHYNLLEIIQKKLMSNLNFKFFQTLLTDLLRQNENELQIERFSQILIVALQNKCVEDFNEKAKAALIKKLPSNILLAAYLNHLQSF